MNVELLYWGYSRATAVWNVPRHRHDYWQSSFACAGRCVFRTGSAVRTILAGEILFIPPGVEHSLEYDDGTPYESYTLKFRTDAENPPAEVLHWAAGARSAAVLQAVKVLMEAYFPSEKFGDPLGAVVLPGESYPRVVEGMLAGLFGERIPGGFDNTLSERARRWLRKQSGRRVTATALAAGLGFSRSHFSARLESECGLAAKAFIDRETMTVAERLLLYTEQPIGVVAERLGFRDLFAFDAFFRRNAGCTPGEFRRRARSAN